MSDDSEWLALPIDEKLSRKEWKARAAAYDEILTLVKSCESFADLRDHAGTAVKWVSDTNAVAQSKGVITAAAFVLECPSKEAVCLLPKDPQYQRH